MTHMQGLDSLSTTLWLTLFQRISPITRIPRPLLMYPLVYLLLRFSHYGITYLGHIIRHPASPEFHMCFNNSLSLRTISSPFRRGAPRAHWPEIAFAESAHGLQRNINPPVLGFFLHQFFTHFAIVELKTFSAASMKQWYNTTRFVHLLFPVAENREQCKFLTPKMK